MCSWRTLGRMPKRRGRSSCCVFVSHKQQDVAYAERIAYGVTPTTLRAIGPLNIHTSGSAASKWIPYEFGRAKDRPLRSTGG
jgi:hypothetical protein